MKINISNDTKIEQIQQDFNKHFPYLLVKFLTSSIVNGKLEKELTVSDFRKSNQTGTITLFPDMSVSDLETIFKDTYGLDVQIRRKLGSTSFKPRHTILWSLEEHNKQGESISQHLKNTGNNNIQK